MLCIGRITKVDGIRHFHDGKHRFYLEYRCNKPVVTSDLCGRCTGRTTDKIQSSGKFNHGRMDQTIPDHSHIYGGTHYQAGCIANGPPSTAAIQEAEEYHRIASEGIVLQNTIVPIEDVIIEDIEPVVEPVIEPVIEPV